MKLAKFLSKNLHSHIITYAFVFLALILSSSTSPQKSYALCGILNGSTCWDSVTGDEYDPYVDCQFSAQGNDICCQETNQCPSACTGNTCDSNFQCSDPSTHCEGAVPGSDCSGTCVANSCTRPNCSDNNECFANETCEGYTGAACSGECIFNTVPPTGQYYSCDQETDTCVVCSPNDNLPGPYGGCEFASLDTCSCLPRPDVKGDCPDKHVDTALGCIPVEQGPFTTAFFRFLVGIAGGLALIVMLIGAIIFLTGGSNPEQVKKGKEIFFGALAGLLFIIISTILLRTIAGDIIGLPAF